MAEKIAGIIMREIDQSQPTRVRPEGIPAGVIGTAAKGPAFVPVVFASTNDFAREFGSSRGGEYFGPIAVAEWMKNSKAGLYLRTLGVGNGEKASGSDGTTEYAGFVVGEQIRDKDRTSAGTSPIPVLETDDDVDVPIANPYAGAAVEDQLSIVDNGLVEKTAAVAETTTLDVGFVDNNSNQALNTATLEGAWFVVDESPTVRRAFYITAALGAKVVVNSNDVQDGLGGSLADFGTIGGTANSAHIIALDGMTLESEIIQAISDSISDNVAGMGVVLTQQDQLTLTAGTAGAVAGALIGGAAGKNVTESETESDIASLVGGLVGSAVGAEVGSNLTKKDGIELLIETDAGKLISIIQEISSYNYSKNQRVRIIKRNGKSRVVPFE